MKQLISSRTLDIPDGVSVEVKARKVRVKGSRGMCRHMGWGIEVYKSLGVQSSFRMRTARFVIINVASLLTMAGLLFLRH